MRSILVDKSFALMKVQRYGEAQSLLHQILRQDQSDWQVWYLAGQCCRFTNDIKGAIYHLSQATILKQDVPSIYLALGIAYQLAEEWDHAIDAFRKALELDPDNPLLYNSLALTQKKRGEIDKALHNYDAGVKAFSRRIVLRMLNIQTSPIHKHRDTDSNLWVEYATYAAIYLAASDKNVKSIAWPTGVQASEEERTEKHRGLYWEDVRNKEGEIVRIYLPNFFNTFRESLRQDVTYSNLIGNRGTALEIAGQEDEAQRHFQEAMEFSPPKQ